MFCKIIFFIIINNAVLKKSTKFVGAYLKRVSCVYEMCARVSSCASQFLTTQNSLNSYVTTRYKGYSFEATLFVRWKEKLYGCATSVRGDSAASLCEVRTTQICVNRH